MESSHACAETVVDCTFPTGVNACLLGAPARVFEIVSLVWQQFKFRTSPHPHCPGGQTKYEHVLWRPIEPEYSLSGVRDRECDQD
jgi:hypothetical protein